MLDIMVSLLSTQNSKVPRSRSHKKGLDSGLERLLELVGALADALFLSWLPLEAAPPLEPSLRPACASGRETEGGVAPIEPPAVGVEEMVSLGDDEAIEWGSRAERRRASEMRWSTLTPEMCLNDSDSESSDESEVIPSRSGSVCGK